MMLRRLVPWVFVVVVIGAGGAWYLLTRPEPLSDEQQILRLIADVQRAVEQRKTSDVMRYVSEDYHDTRGLDRRAVQRLVMAGARDRSTMDLSVQVTSVEVQGDSATFAAEVDYSVGGPAMPGQSNHLTVRGELRRERGGWKVASAEGWQDAESGYFQ